MKVGEKGQYNYAESIQACANIGSTLATVTSQADIEALETTPGIPTIRGSNPVWLGLNDIAIEGSYEWQDGTV